MIGPPSRELMRVVDDIRHFPSAPILDAGCGYGRNALALAARGLSVVCVDQELIRLNTLCRLASKHLADLRKSQCELGRLYSVLARLSPSRWPFPDGCFAGIACVHFLDVALFGAFRSSLI